MAEKLKTYFRKIYCNDEQLLDTDLECYTQHFKENELIGQTVLNNYVVESLKRVQPSGENAAEFDECSKIINYPVDEIWRIYVREKNQIAA